MLATLATLLAVAGISCVQAQNSIYECDSLVRPDWDACDRINPSIPWSDGDDGINVKVDSCWLFTETEYSNCIVMACNYRTDGADQPLNTFTGNSQYKILSDFCKPDKAGGQSPGTGPNIVRVTNRPTRKLSRRAMRSSRGDVNHYSMSVAEVDAMIEQSKDVKPRTIVQKREDSWLTVASSKAVTRGNRVRLSAIADSGSGQSWTTTEEHSSSVTSTVGLSAGFWGVFTASVEISYTYEESVSYAKTITFDPSGKCEPQQSAVLYMAPLYDEWIGYKNGDTSNLITIDVPVKGDNNYAVQVECLG